MISFHNRNEGLNDIKHVLAKQEYLKSVIYNRNRQMYRVAGVIQYVNVT